MAIVIRYIIVFSIGVIAGIGLSGLCKMASDNIQDEGDINEEH